MFASKRNVRLAVTVTAVAAAAFMMNSCGGSKTAAPSSAQVASSGGFKTVTTPATELEDLKRDLEDKGIPCGLGIGESSDEQIASTTSADAARAELATSIGVQVQRLSESYAQNVGNQAKKIWEEGVRQLTDEHLKGARVYKRVPLYNEEKEVWKFYSLMILDPTIFKAALAGAMANQEELELRVKKDDMMAKMDANIAEYNNKYKK